MPHALDAPCHAVVLLASASVRLALQELAPLLRVPTALHAPEHSLDVRRLLVAVLLARERVEQLGRPHRDARLCQAAALVDGCNHVHDA